MKLINQLFLKTSFILLLLCSISFAQSAKKIFGYVYDSNSNLPLVGANIVIDGTSIGTTTDEFGYFQFDNLLAGSYSLTVSYIGYKIKRVPDIVVTGDQPIKVDLYLEYNDNQLDEVIVTSKSHNNALGKLRLFTKEDIAKGNYQSVGELLQQLPGVEIQSTGGAGSSKKISIRGSEANQVLVLLDGVKINNQLSGSADLSQIPTNIIERIEIYEGGSSPKFGNGAIGGTINIITKNQFSNKVKLNTSIGSYGYWQVEPIISGSFGNVSYYLSYNRIRSSNNYSYTYKNNAAKLTDDIRLNSDFQSDVFFSKINYRFDDNTISINAQHFNSDRGIPGGIFSLTPYARSKNYNNTLGLNYTGNFKKVNVKTDFIYSASTTNYTNLFPDTVKPKFKRMPKYQYEYNVKNLVGNFNLIYIPANWYNLTAGYSIKSLDYNDKNFRPTLLSPINNAEDFSQGIFLHQELKKDFNRYNLQLVLTPIIRYDVIKLRDKKINRDEDKWSPGIGFYMSLGKKNKFSIRTNFSKSFRMPTFADLFYQDIRVEGKASLLPETGKNSEITLRAETNSWGKLAGEFTIFKNAIDNLIVWKLGSFEVFRPFNTDAVINGKQYNLEFTTPDDFLSLSAAHTELKPLNKNNNTTTFNKIIPYKPLASTKVKIGLKYKTLRLSLFYRAVGKRYVTEANTIEMPPYKLIDANLSWEIKFNKVKFLSKLSVTNITNEKYQIIRNYPLPLREWRMGISIFY